MVRRKGINRGMSWHLDRAKESQEPWEKDYKRKSRGLKNATKATRTRVARMGGKASRHRRRR